MRVSLARGDITQARVDAIVNAANPSLYGGGGVDGAIHRAGGPAILAACRALRATRYPDGLPVGAAVATLAGDLPARWVIHTVGPVHGRGSADQLRSCYRASLAVGAGLGAHTVAFPLISAGAYRWPMEEAIGVAVEELTAAPGDGEATLVLLGERTYERAIEIIELINGQ
ncbi:MAG: O-acetyl-ADP-ribose deacetylase [Jatrophihabitantaceae bacterium]